MELIYFCKYAKWLDTQGTPKAYCPYAEEAKRNQTEFGWITEKPDCKEIMDIIPNCPEDIKRNENGLRVCFTIKGE